MHFINWSDLYWAGDGEVLSVKEPRQRVRQMLDRKLKWRLVPVHLSLEVYEALHRDSVGWRREEAHPNLTRISNKICNKKETNGHEMDRFDWFKEPNLKID